MKISSLDNEYLKCEQNFLDIFIKKEDDNRIWDGDRFIIYPKIKNLVLYLKLNNTKTSNAKEPAYINVCFYKNSKLIDNILTDDFGSYTEFKINFKNYDKILIECNQSGGNRDTRFCTYVSDAKISKIGCFLIRTNNKIYSNKKEYFINNKMVEIENNKLIDEFIETDVSKFINDKSYNGKSCLDIILKSSESDNFNILIGR